MFKEGDIVVQELAVSNKPNYNYPDCLLKIKRVTTRGDLIFENSQSGGCSRTRFRKATTKEMLTLPFLGHKYIAPEYSPITKDTNPKDACAIARAPMSTVSSPVMMEVGVAMLEGARKYGRHNYRVAGVRASVYYDAAHRHLAQWFEGEDIDPDSGMSHVTKAIASLVVLRDAMINDKMVDDRPPPSPKGFVRDLEEKVQEILNKIPEGKEPFTNGKS